MKHRGFFQRVVDRLRQPPPGVPFSSLPVGDCFTIVDGAFSDRVTVYQKVSQSGAMHPGAGKTYLSPDTRVERAACKDFDAKRVGLLRRVAEKYERGAAKRR